MALLLSLGGCLLLPGCQSLKSLSQCRRVLSTVNDTLDSARKLHAQPPTSQSYRELADLFNDLRLALKDMSLIDPKLDNATKDYARQLRRVGREARRFSQTLARLERATTSGGEEEQQATAAELDRIRVRAQKLVDGIKSDRRRFREACRTHP